MKPIEFDDAYEKHLGAGDNPNTGDLPFCRAADPRSPNCAIIVSCWEPSEEELAEIIRTKRVFIGVVASAAYPTQPPFFCTGVDPLDPQKIGSPLVRIDEGKSTPVTQAYFDMLKAKGYAAHVLKRVHVDEAFFAGARAEEIIDEVNEILRVNKDAPSDDEKTGGIGNDGKAI